DARAFPRQTGSRGRRERNEGVQETVGATVWPALPWQRGYSSVLYLVSRTPNTPHRPFRTSSTASPPEDPRPASRHRGEEEYAGDPGPCQGTTPIAAAS